MSLVRILLLAILALIPFLSALGSPDQTGEAICPHEVKAGRGLGDEDRPEQPSPRTNGPHNPSDSIDRTSGNGEFELGGLSHDGSSSLGDGQDTDLFH